MTPVTCPHPGCTHTFTPELRPGEPGVTCPSCGRPVGGPRRLSLRDLVEGGPDQAPIAAAAFVEFTCPHPRCGATIRGRAERVGLPAICPKCGGSVVIGQPSPPPAAVAPVPEPLRFQCPHCDRRLGASRERLGSTIKCPHCRTRIKLDDDLLKGKAPEPTPEGPALPPDPRRSPPPSIFDLDWQDVIDPQRPFKPARVQPPEGEGSGPRTDRLASPESPREKPARPTVPAAREKE